MVLFEMFLEDEWNNDELIDTHIQTVRREEILDHINRFN